TVQPPFGLWLLGSATGAVVSTAVLQLLNIAPDMAMILTYGTAPLGALAGLLSMRGLLRRFPLLGKLGRTRSVDQLDTGQLRLNIRETTASHLRLTLVLLILLARLIPGESEDETPDSGEIPVNLLHALMKLSRAPEDARTGIAEEVIQEFYNAGYTPDSAEATIIWSEVLREKYDTLGLVNPGDRCRVMEPPVIQGAEIRRKGRVVRDRR
nr:hypothetical protein [bacterium]